LKFILCKDKSVYENENRLFVRLMFGKMLLEKNPLLELERDTAEPDIWCVRSRLRDVTLTDLIGWTLIHPTMNKIFYLPENFAKNLLHDYTQSFVRASEYKLLYSFSITLGGFIEIKVNSTELIKE